jgi:membrane peptidoglycan carboxypeptidase
MRDSRRARRLRVGVGLLAGCAVLAGCVSVRPLALVPPDRVAQTSLVLDAEGRRVAALHGPQDRTAVPLAEVSRWMRLAVVDTEDARFWRHGGVDWLAVARAAARDLERGKVVEGGSTITQQYVKNTDGTGEQTLRRKLAEAGHAWGLERATPRRPSWRPTSTPSTSARAPTGSRPPPRPSSRPRPAASPWPRRPCWPG